MSAGSLSYESFNEALDVNNDVSSMMSEHVAVEFLGGVNCSRAVTCVWCA